VRDVIEVEIVDDGIGGAKASVGSGLEGLRDRIEAIGGKFEIDSPPGRGTRITATIPATAASGLTRPRMKWGTRRDPRWERIAPSGNSSGQTGGESKAVRTSRDILRRGEGAAS
jgi:hypothetical protein